MKVQKTKIEGVFHITPQVFTDERGSFSVPYNKDKLNEIIGSEVSFIQDSESKSFQGVLRGFAFQKGEFAQAKLVRVTEGKVLDVVLDMRQKSKTFGMYVMHELSAENKEQVFIPRGCAHAFVTLSETATFQYKVDNVFTPEEEGGVLFSDPELGIEWPFDINILKVGEKDLSRPLFNDAYKFD